MKNLKSKSILVLLSIIAIAFMLAFSFSVNVNTAKASGFPTITMEKGASARAGVDNVNGLRFIATMSNSEYAWFAENVGTGKTYSSVKFGMIIAPADYLDYADLSEENLFGATPKYDWAVYQDGEWVYTGNNGEVVDGVKTPVRVINTVTSSMSSYKSNGVEKMAVIGSIINYQEHNIVRDFVGRGYYQLLNSDGEVVKTQLAGYNDDKIENNTRSMIGVIQSAIEDEVLSGEQINNAEHGVIATYFTPIIDNVTANNSKIELLSETTVAGNPYTDHPEKTRSDVTTLVYTSEKDKKTEFKWNLWQTSALGLALEDGKVVGKTMTIGSIVTSEYLNLTITVDVYNTIATRADLDALGFDYYEDQNAEKWGYGNIYKLANDIDYETDTSVYTTADGKTFRMDDGNGTQDLWDRYLIPIAAKHDDITATTSFNGENISVFEWGIFGKISGDTSGDHTFFHGTIDGDNYAIRNAVIPYGVCFSYEPKLSGINSNHGSNFIGALVYGGQLRNIAFTGLEFEDPTQIGEFANSSTPNPYYTSANTNTTGTKLAEKGYITQTTIKGGTFGYEYFNVSNRTGLVGIMQNGIISNVYVEAAMKNGTFSTRAVNGLIVAWVEADSYVNGSLNGGISGKVENCIVETSYYSKISWLNYLTDRINQSFAQYHTYNSGMGAVVGTSFLEDKAAISNCFVVGNLQTFTLGDGSDMSPVTTIFSPGTALRHSASLGNDLSTNCGVYISATDLQNRQDEALKNISIASYLEN